jgi:tight adherence protein B
MVSAAITAGAVLCWPSQPAAQRLRHITGQATSHRPTWRTMTRRVPSPLILIAIAAVLALPLLGTGVAITIAVGGITTRALWRSHQRTTRQLTAAEAMADAVHGLVAELRSGAHPVVAAESAAKDAREPASAVLKAISATARLGGDLTASIRGFATENPTLAPTLRPLAHAWSLAQRHGLPLAEVLDAVRKDVAGRVRFAHRVRAKMAGPKASGTVLAVLPLLGIALGEGMGAHPTHILLTTPLGQTLLATGTTLICAGMYWITHLTTRSVLS